MGVNQMTGTPWHTERFHRKENDSRRYKGRCEYYIYEKDQCRKRCGRCMGSAHCNEYVEISEEVFRKRQKDNIIRQQKKRKSSAGEDDCYWY